MFVVAVQCIWRDDEQAQIVVVGLDQTFLAHERSVSVIIGKPRSNLVASVARIGDPGKVRHRSLDRIGEGGFSTLGDASNGPIDQPQDGQTSAGDRSNRAIPPASYAGANIGNSSMFNLNGGTPA
jgi:hypothetical protein